MVGSCSERGWFPPRKSTASRESAWTCRSARAELGKPLRGFPHGPHRAATTASSFHAFHSATQTGRRRVFIMTTIQTQRPTLVYRGLLLSRLNRIRWPTFIPALTPYLVSVPA
jgi:hypothetical protein